MIPNIPLDVIPLVIMYYGNEYKEDLESFSRRLWYVEYIRNGRIVPTHKFLICYFSRMCRRMENALVWDHVGLCCHECFDQL